MVQKYLFREKCFAVTENSKTAEVVVQIYIYLFGEKSFAVTEILITV